MKSLQCLVVVLFFSFNYCFAQESYREPTLISLSKSTFLSTMIAKPLIQTRCETYQGNTPLQDFVETIFDPFVRYSCERVTSQLFTILNIKTLEDQEGYIGRAIFTDKLLELIKKPQTEQLLKLLIQQFLNASKNKKFELYDLLINSKYKLSKQIALEFLAVLFQDTNSLQHIYYLKLLKQKEAWSEQSVKSKNLELLTELNEYFQQLFFDFHNDLTNNFVDLYNFYPNDTVQLTAKDFQPAIYHFYTTGYITSRLTVLKNKPYYAFIAPYALRVTYEQVFNETTDLSNFDTYLIALGKKEPPLTNKYKQVDLYLSAVGGYWALNNKSIINFNQFANLSSNNMPKMLRLMTKKL